MGIFDRFKRKKAETPKHAEQDIPVAKKERAKDSVAKSSDTTADATKAPESEAAAKTVAKKETVKRSGHISDILLRPSFTEKTHKLADKHHVVVEVARHANKIMVKEAFKATFGVTPVSVRIMVTKGKRMRFRGTRGQRKSVKKAIITLAKGEHIDLFEQA